MAVSPGRGLTSQSLSTWRLFEQASNLHDVPEKISIDKSGANTASVRGLMEDSGLSIELRQSKYFNNIVERDHRAIKRRVRPLTGR